MKFKTLFALATLALSANLYATPQFRFGELVVQAEKVDIYRQAIHTDIADTLLNETTALTMYALPKATQPNDFFVVEIYQDATAEQAHRQQSWYQKFVADTQGIYQDRRLIEVEPRFLQEATAITLDSNTPARVSRYRAVKNQDLTALFQQYRGHLTDGRLAVYVVQSTTDPHLWYEIDVYANDQALKADPIPARLGELATLEQSDDIQNGVMENKGGLHFVR